jgi:uncharacterized membrane protein
MNNNTNTVTRGERTLGRLETLIDGVFAIVIVLLVLDFPRPAEGELIDLSEFFSAHLKHITLAGIGLLVVFIYWVQSNALCGYLKSTDNRHAGAMVAQIFFVLIYLYFVGLSVELENDPIILALQSGAAALIGIAAAMGWWYASSKPELVAENTDPDEIEGLRLRVLAEPLTALLTLGLAFIGPVLWELGWLAYPLIAALLRRTRIFPGQPAE